MYFVTEIFSYNAKKVRVKLEGGFTFALYKSEIRKYNIKENNYISESVYNEILNDVLLKRAKERALYILKDSAKTKKQIVEKLARDYYPSEIIEKVLDFLEEYNYINDYSYTVNYIENNTKRKGINRIKNDLMAKGISKEMIHLAIGDVVLDDEISINNLINKKISKYNLNDNKDKRRLYALLQRNGYNHETIMKALDNFAQYIDVI